MKPNPSSQQPYQLLPSLTDNEYKALKESIRENGVQNPILIDEAGEILDGHHRWQICQELSVDCPYEVMEGLTVDEKRERALILNLLRRNLSLKQKRKIVADLLRADPSRSNNSIAKTVGISDVTVASIRRELGLFSDKIKGADGKEYKAGGWTKAADQTAKLHDQYAVFVEFEKEADQLAFIEEIMKRGLKCRALIS